MRYATGKNAWAMCRRCGMRGRYVEMVDDGQYPGLRVHPECRDMKHPVEKPLVPADDGIVLRKPSPDTDDDSPGGDNGSLADYFDARGERYFGGGT
jgi:hypothetical protein